MIELNDSLSELVLAASLGLLLGGLYFGGLWLTVRHVTRATYPGLLLTASLFLRLAMVAAGLYLLADGHWQRYLAALPGLWLARRLCVRRIAPKQAAR